MTKLSKRLNKLNSLITKKTYSFEEAIKLVKSFQSTKFEESLEAHVALNINPKYADQQLRSSLILPNGTGKILRVAVFTESENVSSALQWGANIAGSDDLLEEINSGKLNFDVLITTPNLIPKLAKLGKILGPKSLMPSQKSGTVTNNIKETISEFTKGKLEYRVDKTGVVHLIFGKSNFSEPALSENLLTIYNSILKNKPTGVKGKYFKSFYICSTMSPSLSIDIASFK